MLEFAHCCMRYQGTAELDFARCCMRYQGAAKLEFARCCVRICRKELAVACARAGLAPLSERELGFVESARNRHLYSALLSPHHLATNTTSTTRLEPGFLELVEAAVAAGAVRVVEVDDVWYVQQADWAAAGALIQP